MTAKFELAGALAFTNDDDFIVFDPEAREPIPYTRDGAFIFVADEFADRFAVMRFSVPASIKARPEEWAECKRRALKGY